MDAWWPRLVAAEFKPALGSTAYDRFTAFQPPGDPIGGAAASPDWETGWYGYVSKDLRDLFGPRPQGPRSRVYCGGGPRGRRPTGLRQSPGGGPRRTRVGP